MLPPLLCHPLGPSLPHAHLPDFLWVGEGWDLSTFEGEKGESLFFQSQTTQEEDGWVRGLWNFLVVDGIAKTLDFTGFSWDEHTFAEDVRRRHEGGPNLHPAPLYLPTTLHLHHIYRPAVGAQVSLTFVGPGRLSRGDRRADGLTLLCLTARQGPRVVHQWMAKGIGEVALLTEGGIALRGITGFWAPGAEPLLLGGDPGVSALPRQALPPWKGERPVQDGIL